MFPKPRSGRSGFGSSPQATPRLFAACPETATPLGVVSVPQSSWPLAPIASPGLYGFAEAGTDCSWFRLRCNVRCVPLNPYKPGEAIGANRSEEHTSEIQVTDQPRIQ